MLDKSFILSSHYFCIQLGNTNVGLVSLGGTGTGQDDISMQWDFRHVKLPPEMFCFIE